MLHKKIEINRKTKLLLSVKNFSEISIVKKYADIIDLKNPKDGALGSWKKQEISLATNKYKNNIISATLGNLIDYNEIKENLLLFDELGLNYVKVGFFQEDISAIYELFDHLNKISIKTKLVAVIFAENKFLLDFVLKNTNFFLESGFSCVLIDTCKKDSSNLLSLCSEDYLKNFISSLKNEKLMIGLSGRLKIEHIPLLLNLEPDIIGIRSAACVGFNRSEKISKELIKKIKNYFISDIRIAQDVAGA
tara:strand:+ start:298 stop:1044 length:747 start_codon:yes stop_codon:yes gene_type:complete